METSTVPLTLEDISVRRGQQLIIDHVTFRLERDQYWAIIGPNGSGKSTLLRVAALYQHPSSGTVEVLGERLGSTDVRRLRRLVGYAAPGLAGQFRNDLIALDVVMTAKHAALEPWWNRYDDADRAAARRALQQMRVDQLAQRPIGTLSSGERQRVMLARTLMTEPALILLDEPSAGLDLGGREQLVAALDDLMHLGYPMAVVTHHLSEIAPSSTHAMVIKAGRVLSAGPIGDTLVSSVLSEAFELPLQVERRDDGRFNAYAVR